MTQDMEVILDSCTNSKLKIKLFKDVKNVEILRQLIIAGKLQCCIIKPTLILDPLQIIVAANKAAVAQQQNSLITRTVYSEILFNLSTTKNVTKSLTMFGIDDKHTSLLVVVIYQIDDAEHGKSIFKRIEGVECNISELSSVVDYNLVKKTYGINTSNKDIILKTILNKIVCKDF